MDDPVTVAGLRFPNRVGLGAGPGQERPLHRRAGCDGLRLHRGGHGHAQGAAGQPQTAHVPAAEGPRPDQPAGFNNEGLAAFIANVKRAHSFRQRGGIVGLNIGKNAATPIENAVDDYLLCLDGVAPHADYVTVNVSSPNTKNLRALQSDEALDALLSTLAERRDALTATLGRRVPMFVKIAPDLDDAQIAVIAATLQRHALDGVIATNTTIARDAVQGMRHGDEAGGLSGAPVMAASNRVIRALRQALGPGFPIIGAGGVFSGADARAKIEAGADLVQIYTGLIYQGPGLVGEVARALKTR